MQLEQNAREQEKLNCRKIHVAHFIGNFIRNKDFWQEKLFITFLLLVV